MDIRFLKANGIHLPGAVVRDYHGGAAAELIRRGIAQASDTTPPPGPQANGGSSGSGGKSFSGKKHRR